MVCLRVVDVSKGMNCDVCCFKQYYVRVKIWEKHLSVCIKKGGV